MPDNTAPYDLSAAFDPASSVFVSANAGAGKTSLLTNRVLRLLLHGVPPSRILCLTFTKAAAAEMSNRILEKLGAWVMADDESRRLALLGLIGGDPGKALMQRARRLFAAVLEEPEGVRIQTLHGFCQSLLRRFPVEAGVSPHFNVMDERSEQDLLREARLRLFGRAQNEDPRLQQSLAALARALSESSLQALLGEIVKHKRKIRSLFAPPDAVENVVAALWRRAGMRPDSDEAALVESHFAYDETTLAQLRRIAQLLPQGGAADRRTGEGLARWLESGPRRAAGIDDYLKVFFRDNGEPWARIFTAKALPDPAHAELLMAERGRAERFHDRRKSQAIARHTTHLLYVTDGLLAIYDTLKHAHALMDYDDLILSACRLLQRPGIAPWVLFKLDGGIDHVLVDEAQDTSPEQWAIVHALTDDFFNGQGRSDDERSLFVVGDEKQSIFSFQGADPAGFGRIRLDFPQRIRDAGRPVRSMVLTHSFRSTAQVLAAVDAIFAPPDAKSGLMFDENATLSHTPTRLAHPGLVELWPLVTPPEDEGSGPSPVTQLARGIAAAIRGWLDQGVMLEARDRPLAAGDIMILVRQRGSLVDRLVRALKRLGVPVAGQDRMALGDNIAVRDLIALGQCLLLPDDDLTLAALLKSPVFGLSEDDLFRLAWQREGKSLWERLQTLGREGGAFAPALDLLSDLRGRADFLPPFELYSHLLDTLGARRKIIGRMGAEYHDAIDEFLGQALLYERGHASSLQGFLHWLGAGESQIKRDMEQSKDGVRIMTVHGAKGLQAPVVILPDTTELPRLRDTLLWHEDGGQALPLWLPSVAHGDMAAQALREERQREMMAEYRRLLYVALTRAEDRLYICGATGRKKVSDQCWYELARRGLEPMAQPFDMPWGTGLRAGDAPVSASGPVAAPYPSSVPKDDGSFAFLARPAPDEPVPPQPLTPSLLAGDEPASAAPLSPDHVLQRGIFIHRLLQCLPEIPEAKRDAAARHIATGYAALPDDMRERCIGEARAVMGDAASAFLFAPGSMSEVPVAGCVEVNGRTVTVAGQIDRLHIGPDEVWIADFKSNRLPPAGTFPARYLRQMRLYQLLLQRIYPGKTIRCAIVWTAAAKFAPLPQPQLDEALAGSYI